MLTNEQFTCLAEKYIDTVFRVAFNYLKSSADADDVTQNVFLKLLKERKPFEGENHVKHWLIRVTVNECKNLTFDQPGHSDLFYAVMNLPQKYRLPIYLHHYEGYSTQEVAEILKIPQGTVCIRLKRGRELLKNALTEVDDNV